MAREMLLVIFINELDSLCGLCGEGSESEDFRRRRQNSSSKCRVLTIMMTKSLFLLPQTLHMLWIRLCGDVSRNTSTFRYLILKLGNTCSSPSGWYPRSPIKSDFESLAHRTDDFFGSGITVCDGLFEPMSSTQDTMSYFPADNVRGCLAGQSNWAPFKWPCKNSLQMA